LATLTGWGGKSSAADPAPAVTATPKATLVQTVRPVRRTVTSTVEQPGQIMGFEQTPLQAKISGYVHKLHADIGDRVHKGQVLAELFVPEMEDDLLQKEAAVQLAQAQITLAERAFDAAKA